MMPEFGRDPYQGDLGAVESIDEDLLQVMGISGLPEDLTAVSTNCPLSIGAAAPALAIVASVG